MLSLRILSFTLLFLPEIALSNYDPEKIKETISNNQELFAVSDWQQGADKTSWIATSTQKWLSITVGQDRTEIASPFINAKQITAAKARCLSLAKTGLQLESEEEHKKIMKLIKNASQHYRPKFLKKNNARFEVAPKVVGAFVKLFCTVKSSS